MPFGITNAPSYFQKIMRKVLRGIEDIIIYMDDILVFGKTCEEMTETLKKVLERLKESKFLLKISKCEFGMREIDILGFTVNEKGIKPNKNNTKAIINMKEPTNSSEVATFLGMVDYFITPSIQVCTVFAKKKKNQ